MSRSTLVLSIVVGHTCANPTVSQEEKPAQTEVSCSNGINALDSAYRSRW